jgi:Stage II sporulation protein E (SpoIIE)
MTLPFTFSDRRQYRWFKVWLWASGALAMLMLVNSVWSYKVIARRVQMDQTRRDLTAQAADLDQEIQNTGDLKTALHAEIEKSAGKIAWIEVRGISGSAAHAGMPAGRTFSIEEIRTQLRNRQSAFKAVATPKGEVGVEAFPARMPDGSGGWQPAMMEIASFTRGGEAALWPVRRNLIINCSAAVTLLIALAVMGFRLRSYIKGKQLEQEVEIAHHVQRDLLPSAHHLPEEFELAAESLPAEQVSGDFYDAFPVDKNGAAFVLGDVSGKGIPAALLMGVMQGAIRSTPWTESPEEHERATGRINRLLCERASDERYSTLFWSYFDAGRLRYINAGHCAPLLFKADGSVRTLEEGGPVLGLLPDAGFRAAAVEFGPGDTLVLYSDGIVEAADSSDEQFGEQRLQDLVREFLDLSPGEIERRVWTAVNRFTGNASLSDDRTLVVVRYQGRPAAMQQPVMEPEPVAA